MSRWQDLLSMLSERRVGFLVDETMAGTHRFLVDFDPGGIKAGDELPLAFEATWGHPQLERFANPLSQDFLFNVLTGSVSAGGLCEATPIKGTLELRYFKDSTIRYTFEFEAHGLPLRYVGVKRGIRPWNLHRTHTTCYGTITDLSTDTPLSDSVVHFDLKLLASLAASLRLA